MEAWISRVCCQNARRIWASTPQIAEDTEDTEDAERRGVCLSRKVSRAKHAPTEERV